MNSRVGSSIVLAAIAAVLGMTLGVAAETGPSPVKFVMHRVGDYRSEACCIGDFNKDSKLDIAAGAFLYLAPDWKRVEIRKPTTDVDDKGKGYCHDFMNLPLDVDGDGLLDVVACFWHEKSMAWYRNTGEKGGLWPETVIVRNGNFECGDLCDIAGTGKANQILPHVQETVWYELVTTGPKRGTFARHLVSEKKMQYGGGTGDVNADGRIDIIRPDAWFEAPTDPRAGKWKEHPVALGGREEGKTDHTPEIRVYDVNGDGLNDLVTSSAHKHGIFWYEQVRDGDATRWKRHLIDDSWSQAHSITLADIDGDGLLDLVTGKRFMAHNGGDPDAFGTLGVYWYQLKRKPNVTWTRHAISLKEGIGSGMNLPVVDLDGDGDLDVVVTGKWGGPVWFENKRTDK
ncbi:MAG: VCBS repeat-containing protein [Phycisphaerae bacterium]|nr:VCBS repeat-containing protein [Phycisphaerae bacterium]